MKCEIVKIENGYYLRRKNFWGGIEYADADALRNDPTGNTRWWPKQYKKWARFSSLENLEDAIENHKAPVENVEVIKKIKFKFKN